MSIQKQKLWLRGFCPERSDEEIRDFCNKFGKALHIARPRARDYVFLTYATEDDALQAQANFIRERYCCKFAKLNPKHDELPHKSAFNATSSSDRQQSESPPAFSPSQDKKRVHFSNNVCTQQMPSTPLSGQQSTHKVNGRTNLNGVSIASKKTIFRNGEAIIITHVQNAKSFYAHPVSKDNERRQLLDEIFNKAKTIDCVKKPEKMRMVLAPYERHYYRAILKGEATTLNDMVVVTLVDVGVSVNVPYEKLKPIPEKYTKIRITTRFNLDDINAASAQSYGVACLQSYVGMKLEMKCDGEFAESLSNVQLINPDTKQSINNVLKYMDRRFSSDEMTRTTAPIGPNKMVIPVDISAFAAGFNQVTFIDAKNLPQFDQQSKQLQTFGDEMKSYPPFEPKETELCLAMVAGKWYRAIFVESNVNDSDDVSLLLVDLCKGVTVKSKAIRNITIDMVHMPILAFLGTLKDYDETIDRATVAKLIHKFKPMTTMHTKTIAENTEMGLYTIEM